MSALFEAGRRQQIAADPDVSVFVTANAGSGKTKVLVDRIARLLLRGFAPSSFLCITYTKAAAAEMQRRLYERLGRWSITSDAELAQRLIELDAADAARDAAGLRRARGLFARALETPGGLKIQTIHAFCERLLRRFPLESGARPGFAVADEAAMAAMFAQALEAAAQHTELSGSLRRLGRIYDGETLTALLAQAANPALPNIVPQGDPDALRKELLSGAPWPALREAAHALAGFGKRDQELADRLQAAFAADPEDQLEAYLDCFFREDGQPRTAAPTAKARSAHAWIDRLFQEDGEAGRVRVLRDGLVAAERSRERAAFADLARFIGLRMSVLKQGRSALSFADLIERAQALLGGAAAAAWVLYKLDGGLDHVLIDEGQDTSPGQWALVRPLREEFFAGDGAKDRVRTVFAVGDPKQSIYSFQGADPAGFLRESQALAAAAAAAQRGFVAPSLEMSFRSAPEILQAVDAVFADGGLGGGAPGAFDVVRHQSGRPEAAGCVEWWPIAPRSPAPEVRPWDAPFDQERVQTPTARLAAGIAQWAAAVMRAGEAVEEGGALRPIRPGDLLVLVQRRGPLFQQLIRAFKRQGLPVAGADRMVLRDEIAVEDLAALARAALFPGDDLSLACALKGPLIGLVSDDEDLFRLAHGREPDERLIDRLMAAADPRYDRAKTVLRAAMDLAGADPFTFFSGLLETPDAEGVSGWGRMLSRLGEEARDPIEELLARALDPAFGPNNLRGFLHRLETDETALKRELDNAGDAVRVMTVHGAKGLEAPVVILPDCAGAPPSASGLAPGPEGPVLLRARRLDDEAAAKARAAADAAAAEEHGRLLYVAMTRARDRLIVCAHASGPGEGRPAPSSWHARVGAALEAMAAPFETPFGTGLRLGAPRRAEGAGAADATVEVPGWARAPAQQDRAPVALTPSRLSQRAPTAAFSVAAEGLARFQRGRLIHGLLQRLPDAAPDQRGPAGRAWLAANGVDDAAAAAMTAEALAVIEAPDFAPCFAPGGRAEAPILGRIAGLDRPIRGVIDRLAIGPDRVLAIDFKTDRPAPGRAEDIGPAYVEQMALYRALLRQAFPGREVACALVWTEIPRLMPLPEAMLEAALQRVLAGGIG